MPHNNVDECCNSRLSHLCRAAYQQLQLLRVADFLNVGQRLRKTVRFHVTGPAGNDSAVQVVLERRDKHYSLDDAHEVRRGLTCTVPCCAVRGMWAVMLWHVADFNATPHIVLYRFISVTLYADLHASTRTCSVPFFIVCFLFVRR